MTLSFWAWAEEGDVTGAEWARGEEEEMSLEGQRCAGHPGFEGYGKSSGFTLSIREHIKVLWARMWHDMLVYIFWEHQLEMDWWAYGVKRQ